MAAAFLLAGRPGVGKTTIVREIVTRLGPRAGGFYTAEIREGGRRTGFRLIALDGQVGTPASVNGAGQHRVSKYVVPIGFSAGCRTFRDREGKGVACLTTLPTCGIIWRVL
jgi:nucleoside-triphosphatase THEP1